MKIENLPISKQYDLTSNKTTNSLKQNTVKITSNSLTLANLLENLSLEVTEQHKLIALELLKANLPLKQNLFTNINQFLTNTQENLPYDNETKTKVAILLKQLNLPLDAKFFQVFKEFNPNLTNLKQALTDLLSGNNLNSLKITTPEKSISFNLKEALNLPSNLVENLNLNENQNIVTNLKKIINHLNSTNLSSPEKKTLLNNLKQLINNNPQLLSSLKEQVGPEVLKNILNKDLSQTLLTKQQTFTTSELLARLNLTSKVTAKLNICFNQKPTPVMKKLINHLLSNDNQSLSANFKRLLINNPDLFLKLQNQIPNNKLTKLIQKISLSPPEKNQILTKNIENIFTEAAVTPENITPEQIRTGVKGLNFNSGQEQLIKLLFHLTSSSKDNESLQKGQKLLNQLLSLKAVNYESNILTLFFPVAANQEFTLARLKINKEQLNNSQEDKILKFSFAVETEKLGTVEVKVKIYNHQINTLFITNNQETKKLITRYGEKFKENLQTTDYNLNYFDCKLTNQDLSTADKQEINLNSIDFTI